MTTTPRKEPSTSTSCNQQVEVIMSKYEMQIRNTGKLYDQAIRDAEGEGIEILESFVPDSRLHEVINNPVDSGIDEG
jgi:hypothetical protein